MKCYWIYSIKILYLLYLAINMFYNTSNLLSNNSAYVYTFTNGNERNDKMNVWNKENPTRIILDANAFNFYSYVIVEINKVDNEIVEWLLENRDRDLSSIASSQANGQNVLMINCRGDFLLERGGARIPIQQDNDMSFRRDMGTFAQALEESISINKVIERFNKDYAWDEVIKEVVILD